MQDSSVNEDHSNPDKSTRKSPAQILKEKKKKLREDIKELKELNFQIECSLNISKFGDIKHLLKSPEIDFHNLVSKRIADVETQYMDELFKMGGMHCTKFTENQYVFSFSSSGNFIGKDTYAVQITDASGEPKIGKWVMPISIDINNIVLETPLNNPMDLKPFLTNCKHHIDCYSNRVQQYDELKLILDDLSGCWLDSSLGHTAINLKFFDVEDLESGESHNIVLYLIYEPNRVRPHKIKVDPLDSKTLAQDLVNRLKKYFKFFKCHDLKQAFEETIEAEDTSVVWKKGDNQGVLNLDDSSASSSEENFVPQRRGKTAKRKTKGSPIGRGKKRKAAETSLRSQDSADLQEDDLNSERVDDLRGSLIDLVDKIAEKSVNIKAKGRGLKNKALSKSSPKKNSKKNKTANKNISESRANVSERNLKQRTLDFQVQRSEKGGETQLNNNEGLTERVKSSVDKNMTKQKSKSNSTMLRNNEFGTSTPVSKLNLKKKRFVYESTDVSPIKSTANVTLKKKQQLRKTPG